MSKDSAAWLAIRIIGLLLAGQTLLFLCDLSAQFIDLAKLYSIGGSLASEAQKQIIRTWIDAGIAFVEMVVFGALSCYFLRRGKTIHRLLMREAP